MKYYATADRASMTVTVVDEGAEEVLRDIVDPSHGLLTGADTKLAEYGYRRMGYWKHQPLGQWLAEVARKKKEA